ncbi:3-deoxy-D-manno-octulosonic acid transferase [Lutimaribacter marinistellae]|uniref:3-deoxy-D-manno-octulosonic acid transferase n=1 Tax=Lutimaribacter marinistellae TaxID=1820329 RepID=A0ABV7T9B8_9RHOB
MPRSLSLAAYRALSWRGGAVGDVATSGRPDGELLWLHVAAPDRLSAVNDLCRRLLSQRTGLNLLLTSPEGSDKADWGGAIAPLMPLPPDQPGVVRSFLNHWRPDAALWVGGGLQPLLLSQAAARGMAMILTDVQSGDLVLRKRRWLPDLARATLDVFDHIRVTDEETGRAIRRTGIPGSKVALTPLLQVGASPQPWPEDELVEITRIFAGRPVWLAAWTQPKEFISVLSAHRHALRLLHRLLLVIHVADPAEAAPLRDRLRDMDLRCADWDAGEEIEDNTQVILSAHGEDLGLWYRVSPLTFLGSSLEPGGGGKDPLTAAALGSALLHGPDTGEYRALYRRLTKAGAARCVRDGDGLGRAVVELLAPDRAATMALAGWQVVTEGAEAMDSLIDLVQDRLDRRKADNART